MMQRVLTQVPDVPVGAIFNPRRGFLSVVIPLERTNLVTNPSFESGTTGYAQATGGETLTQVATQQCHGVYSLSVAPGAGLNNGVQRTMTLTSATTYAASCDVLGVPGVPYQFRVVDGGGTTLRRVNFTGTGYWQRVGVVFTTIGTSNIVQLLKNSSASTGTFYTDGWQVELISDGILAPTTYIDGDQAPLLPNQFPPPYRWNGTPHASTSTRLVSTAAGGYIVNFDRYRYKALAYVGLGLTAVANVATVGANADGAQYQTTVAQSRQFSVNGFWDSDTPVSLDQFRTQLYSALGPDHAAPRQPTVLFYQPCDGDDETGAAGRIVASYERGLEQTATPVPRENAPISFTQFIPGITIGDGGTELTEQLSVSNANRILKRSSDGTWSALSTGASSNDVLALAEGLDGKIYIGGRFGDLGGVANTDGIGYWDPSDSAFHAMGTGVSSGTISVTAIAVAPNGDVYVGGSFSLMGGVANTVRIARWDGSAWNALSTGVNGQVRALAVGHDGTLYLGGAFTDAGGDVNADSIARWNGSAFSALGTGSVAAVNALAIGLDGQLYAGGPFSNMGGVADADSMARWDGTTWNGMSTGMSGGGPTSVNAIAIGLSGEVYAGGSFTTAGGVTVSNIAVWNGTGWATMGEGVGASVFSLSARDDGAIFAGGVFTTAGGITLPDGQALWNGSAWVALDVDLPSTATTFTFLTTGDGTIYIGFDTSGTATAAGITAITNSGTARTYPTIRIAGPSSGTARIYQILNTRTGALLYLNLTMNASEIVLVRVGAQGATIESNFRGMINSVILPGSSQTLALEKGANTLSFFTTSTTVAARAWWPITLQSASDLVSR